MAQLQALALHFEQMGMPAHGRYVRESAVMDESGVVYVPAPVPDPLPKIAAGVAIAVGTAAVIAALNRHRSEHH
mgnify:CR=1 FL=1